MMGMPSLGTLSEWGAADFRSVTPLEVCLLVGFGLALYRGISLPPLRLVLGSDAFDRAGAGQGPH